MDDCGCWQVVRLVPQAIVRLPGPPERPILDWAELLATGALRHRLSEYRDIPAGVALAPLVVAAGGAPVEVAPGPVAELLGRALGALRPAGAGRDAETSATSLLRWRNAVSLSAGQSDPSFINWL
ncbi:hypothetical protein ACIPJS_13175 [Streptomyces sp. NPDC086783]|uniref:hypothetical protein n=1 Tax=Streptomyces sp. NPDC086783 TaxID=3365758 RepID=UPI0037F56701